MNITDYLRIKHERFLRDIAKRKSYNLMDGKTMHLEVDVLKITPITNITIKISWQPEP